MDLIEHAAAAGTIRVEPADERTVIVLVGEIDAALRDEASMCMGLALVAGNPVVIDSTLATFIDSSGLAFILQLHRLGEESGLPVALRDPSPLVVDLLEMIGMTHRIPVVHTLPDTPGDPVAQPA